MKRKRLLTLIGSVCLALALVVPFMAACAPTPTAPTPAPSPKEEVMKWRLQCSVGPGMVEWDVSVPRFVEMVKQASGGRIDITMHPPGVLVPTFEIAEAVGQGVIEMGWTGGSYDASLVPVGEFLYGWPFVFEEKGEWLAFERMGALDIYRRAYGEHNVFPFSYHIGVNYGSIMSTKPASSVADLKGLKVRTFGGIGLVYKKLGATVVQVAPEELYTALATGIVDAATWSSPMGFYNAKFHEITKYYIGPPWSYLGLGFVTNLDLYNSLSDDLKAIILCAGEESFRAHTAETGFLDLTAVDKMTEYGITFMELPDEEVAQIRQVSLELLDTRAGVDKYYDELLSMVKDYLRMIGRL